jgi:hypothetical protein
MPESRGRGRGGIRGGDRLHVRDRKAREPRAAGQCEAERQQPDERKGARDETGGPQRSLPTPPGGHEHVVLAPARRRGTNWLLVLEGRHLHASR